MNHTAAAIFEGQSGEISLCPIPLPVPEKTEVLVRIVGCTLCGSDIHSFEGRRAVPVPTVLGHEIVGEIVAFGETAAHKDARGHALKIGDRVTWAIVASCGQCSMCQSDLPQKCLKGVKYGHEALRPGQELFGGLAGHCLLVAGTSIVRLPDDLPLEVACPANCATATVAAALESAGSLQGRSVLIFGAGMLGLTATAMSRHLGAKTVLCVDPVESRRTQASRFGATDVAAPDQLSDVAREAFGSLGVDVVVELSGSPHAFHAGWPLLRIGGTLVLVGSVFPGEPVPIALEQIVRRHLTIKGIHNYGPRHLQQAVDFLSVAHQQYPFAELVTTWMPLSQISEAFACSQKPDAIRVGVKPD